MPTHICVVTEQCGRGVPGWLSWLSIRLLVSAQVVISLFVGSSPVSGSALTIWNLLGILSLSISLSVSLSLSLSQNKQTKKTEKQQCSREEINTTERKDS